MHEATGYGQGCKGFGICFLVLLKSADSDCVLISFPCVSNAPVSSTATAHVCIHAPREAVLPLQLEVPEDRAGEHGLSPALMQLVSEASHQESASHTESYTH